MLTLATGNLCPPPLRPPLSLLSSPSLTPLPWLKLTPVSPSRRRGLCRAVEFPQDAPFAVSIGACMLNSLLFPNSSTDGDGDDEEAAAAISSTDARFAVMSIISFIPYFNWLSWVFAWMDTGKQRYAVYALVYMAPYLRTNLSLSPDDSWLPIASILLCIAHIQLEASITSGDFDGFSFFNEVANRLGMVNAKKDRQRTSLGRKYGEERRHDMNLPSGQHHYRDEIRKWRMPTKPSEELEHLNEDGDIGDRTKH